MCLWVAVFVSYLIAMNFCSSNVRVITDYITLSGLYEMFPNMTQVSIVIYQQETCHITLFKM